MQKKNKNVFLCESAKDFLSAIPSLPPFADGLRSSAGIVIFVHHPSLSL
jgi:hypothetical protein